MRATITDPTMLPALGDGHHVSPHAARAGRAGGGTKKSRRNVRFGDVGVASENEVIALARIFQGFMEAMPKKFRDTHDNTWLDLYHHMDRDGSGTVDFEEFEWMVRSELHVSSESLPDASLRPLWNALDLDASGTICFGEFGHFMRFLSRDDDDEKEQEPLRPSPASRRPSRASSRGSSAEPAGFGSSIQARRPSAIPRQSEVLGSARAAAQETATRRPPQSKPDDGQHTYMTPTGVIMLSSHDTEEINSVDDPFVRFLLVQKSISHIGRPALGGPSPSLRTSGSGTDSPGMARPPRRPNTGTSPQQLLGRAKSSPRLAQRSHSLS